MLPRSAVALVWLYQGLWRKLRVHSPGAREPANPWASGRLDGAAGRPQLLYGRMNEDWCIEEAVFTPGGRVFCIASAGCTARALAARGFRVTAVDVNPVQVEYARQRAAGAPERAGVMDRRLARVRRALPLLGLTRGRLRSFLELSAPSMQADRWRRELCTWRLRAVLRWTLHPAVLRLSTAGSFVAAVPHRFDRVILARLERAWATHPNRSNPYAWHLLLGEKPAGSEPPVSHAGNAGEISFACADAVDYLERTDERFDGFSLSSILDAAPYDYRARLLAAARRAASPGAVLVVRGIGEPYDEPSAAWAARDRGILWGTVEVIQVG